MGKLARRPRPESSILPRHCDQMLARAAVRDHMTPRPTKGLPFMRHVTRVLALRRGLRHRCPNCGEGRLYRAYLKVVDSCVACGHELGQYRADDGPAYFTI